MDPHISHTPHPNNNPPNHPLPLLQTTRLKRTQPLTHQSTQTPQNHSPSDQFLALIDIGTVHPECRLCQYLADRHRQGEMNKVGVCVSGIISLPVASVLLSSGEGTNGGRSKVFGACGYLVSSTYAQTNTTTTTTTTNTALRPRRCPPLRLPRPHYQDHHPPLENSGAAHLRTPKPLPGRALDG